MSAPSRQLEHSMERLGAGEYRCRCERWQLHGTPSSLAKERFAIHVEQQAELARSTTPTEETDR